VGTATRIEESNLLVDGVRVFMRSTSGDGVPAVLVHGHPTQSEDWNPFLERLEGPAIALDLPGWGRTERPRPERLDTSMQGLAAFFGRFLDAAGIGEYRLACHDWGVISLIAAQAEPERVRRLVVLNAVPLFAEYRWHWIARYGWRRRVLGELFNLFATKPALRVLSRQASAAPDRISPELIEQAWSTWPRGTWPQALALYRSAHPPALAAAGAGLGRLASPALVIWGREDPYLPASFGRRYAEALPNAELVDAAGAGHWPWIDRPDLLEVAVSFLDG